MKTLHDGTEVEDNVPTKNVSGARYLLTQEEIDARAVEEATSQAAAVANYLATYRYNKEVGGILISGVSVPTDRETQSKLIAMRILAKENNSYTVDFKTPAGFVNLNAATIIAIADAIAGHVQKCFSVEASLQNTEFQTIAEIEAAFDAAYAA